MKMDKNYAFVDMWMEINTFAMIPVGYVPLWNEIEKIAQTVSYSGNDLLYKKVFNFFVNGPVGTLYLIKETFGERGLKKFMDFICEFIDITDLPGYYYPSAQIKNQINGFKNVANLIDLRQLLVEFKEIQIKEHGGELDSMEINKRKLNSIPINLVTKKELAKELLISYSTLWRVLKFNNAKAKKYKLKPCPYHVMYSGSRKLYDVDEVRSWITYINGFKD